MTVNELILIDSGKVRRSPDLMAFYIQTFTSIFNYKPNCAGCTFDSDFRKLKAHLHGSAKTNYQTQKINTMSTFQLKKKQGVILSYKNPKTKRTHRAYDNTMSAGFVNGFLTHGSASEIADRKKLFAVLPEKFQDKPKAETKSKAAEKPKAKSEPKKTAEETDKK